MTELQGKIITEILKERDRQNNKWGEQNHSPIEWLPILVEEVGEVAKAICDSYFIGIDSYNHYRKETIEVAAVALAMVECMDRKKTASILHNKATAPDHSGG